MMKSFWHFLIPIILPLWSILLILGHTSTFLTFQVVSWVVILLNLLGLLSIHHSLKNDRFGVFSKKSVEIIREAHLDPMQNVKLVWARLTHITLTVVCFTLGFYVLSATMLGVLVWSIIMWPKLNQAIERELKRRNMLS